MVTVVRGQPTIGAQFGTGISQGVMQRLQELSEQKTKELHQRNLVDALKEARGAQQTGQNPGDLYKDQDQEVQEGNPAPQRDRFYDNLIATKGDVQLAKLLTDNQDKEEQASFRERDARRKENQFHLTQQQPAFEEARKSAEGAKANLRDLDTIIAGAKSGDLQASTSNPFWEALGLEELWRNPTTQLTAKAINRYAQGVTAALGGRVTDQRTKLYQRGFATLNNTADVIEVIAENAKLYENLKVEREKIIQDLLEKGETRNVVRKADRMLEPERKKVEAQESLNVRNAISQKKSRPTPSNKGFDIGKFLKADQLKDLPVGAEVERAGKIYIVTEDGLRAK